MESLKVVAAMLAVQGFLVFFERNLSSTDFVLVTAVIVVVRVLMLWLQTRQDPPGAVRPEKPAQ